LPSPDSRNKRSASLPWTDCERGWRSRRFTYCQSGAGFGFIVILKRVSGITLP
jgi:hypothetical protein